MKILLTNDDGYRAEGIQHLFEELKTIADVTMVAPLKEMSGAGASRTSSRIEVKKISTVKSKRIFGVVGTPAECVDLALSQLLDHRPDWVVSGINMGANVGKNVFCSGTLGAAIQGGFWGIPSIALSINGHREHDFSGPSNFIVQYLKIISADQFDGIVFNCNFPNLPLTELKGIKVVPQSDLFYKIRYDLEFTEGDSLSYKVNGPIKPDERDLENSEKLWLRDGYATVSPIALNLTHPQPMETFARIEKINFKANK